MRKCTRLALQTAAAVFLLSAHTAGAQVGIAYSCENDQLKTTIYDYSDPNKPLVAIEGMQAEIKRLEAAQTEMLATIEALTAQIEDPAEEPDPDPAPGDPGETEPEDPNEPTRPVDPVDPDPAPIPTPGPQTGLQPYYIDDSGEGPSRDFYNRALVLRWRNFMGDYIDVAGQEQGDQPYASILVRNTGWIEETITDLVKDDPMGKGIFITSEQNSGIPRFAGKNKENRPQLIVDGISVPIRTVAPIIESTFKAGNGQSSFQLSRARRVILQFEVPEQFESAVIRLHVDSKFSGNNQIYFWRLNPPTMTKGGDVIDPPIATEQDILGRVDWRRISTPSNIEVTEDGTGITGYFRVDKADPANGGATRLSLTEQYKIAGADLEDPVLGPDGRPVENELFVRMEVRLGGEEGLWNSQRDGNKGGIGWDLRHGLWQPRDRADGGYYQETCGNGGSAGTGMARLRRRAEAPKIAKYIQREPQLEYCGHSIRMEFGKGHTAVGPHKDLRPLQSYLYHLDQRDHDGYGDMVRLGRGVLEVGKWVTIEQRLKMNTTVAPYDAQGNGTAMRDGVLETWLNGQKIHSRTKLAWTRNPAFGIEAIWFNWYYGGKRSPEVEMKYQVRNVVVAREYIGTVAQRQPASTAAATDQGA